MLVLVKLALSLVPCAKEGCTRRATNVRAMKPSRMIKIPERGVRRTVTAFCPKASPRSCSTRALAKLAIRAASRRWDLTRKSLAKQPVPGYLIGLDDRPQRHHRRRAKDGRDQGRVCAPPVRADS